MATIRQLIASEAQEQRALVKWIKTQPHLRDFIIKLNNEGKRTAYQGHDLKLLGMCNGASDLFLAFPTKRHHGLWIEMKRNKKYTQSEMKSVTWLAQERFQTLMKSVGFDAHFCYGLEDGIRIIESYLWVPVAA